ncbi:MAG: hypothetical protein CL913_00385 [Deltaproteobacteria bacterium]|nr:hypothetical protein [Deltaproteobacteria bacterium]
MSSLNCSSGLWKTQYDSGFFWGEEGGSIMEDWRKGLEKDVQEREREREEWREINMVGRGGGGMKRGEGRRKEKDRRGKSRWEGE